MKMQQKRYSEAFKRHVCEELKNGKWTSTGEAASAYNISHATMTRWLDALGYSHIRQRTTHVNTPAEVSELARLRAENRELKATLCDEMLEHRIDRAALEVACERLSVPVETFKKKRPGLTLPDGR